MSLFFLIPTILLYGLCHWIATHTKPGTTQSLDSEFLLYWPVDEIGDALEAWLLERPRMKITQKGGCKITVNQSPSVFSFGAHFQFFWEPQDGNGDETSLFKVQIQPKLIQTTTEQSSFSQGLKKELDSMLIKNSDDNIDFQLKSSRPPKKINQAG